MDRIIDISGRLENGLWGYHELPGLEKVIPEVRIEEIASLEREGFAASRITLSSVSGTYLEAGSHILKGGKNLDEYPIEQFIKPAVLIRLPKQKEKALITKRLIAEHAGIIEPGDAVLLDTGWGAMWNKAGYVNGCPNYLPDAIEWILEKDISILGVDVPCIEPAWSDDEKDKKGGILGSLFGRGTLLLAPLVNLDRITRRKGKLICLPLHVKGVSGAPVRAVFIEQA